MSLPTLLTTADVCALFKISRRTLDDWISAETIPTGFRVGGRRYWHEAELQKFLAEK